MELARRVRWLRQTRFSFGLVSVLRLNRKLSQFGGISDCQQLDRKNAEWHSTAKVTVCFSLGPCEKRIVTGKCQLLRLQRQELKISPSLLNCSLAIDVIAESCI